MSDFGKDLTAIATLLIGVSAMALLVGHAAGTSSLITSATQGFNTLLNTVELSSSATSGGGSSAYAPVNLGSGLGFGG